MNNLWFPKSNHDQNVYSFRISLFLAHLLFSRFSRICVTLNHRLLISYESLGKSSPSLNHITLLHFSSDGIQWDFHDCSWIKTQFYDSKSMTHKYRIENERFISWKVIKLNPWHIQELWHFFWVVYVSWNVSAFFCVLPKVWILEEITFYDVYWQVFFEVHNFIAPKCTKMYCSD